MGANGWRRLWITLWVAWTAFAVGGPVPVHVCPDGGEAAHAAPMAMHRATMHGGAHHPSAPDPHQGHRECICLGCCHASASAAPPPSPSVVQAPTLATRPPPPAGRREPAPAPPDFLRPPSVGPPPLHA
jgi:hypothetical protein